MALKISFQSKLVFLVFRLLFWQRVEIRGFSRPVVSNKILLYSAIVGFICLMMWIGLNFWKENSENERYKYAYYWIYNKQDKKDGKQFVFNIYRDFENDSIFELRKEKVRLTFDK